MQKQKYTNRYKQTDIHKHTNTTRNAQTDIHKQTCSNRYLIIKLTITLHFNFIVIIFNTSVVWLNIILRTILLLMCFFKNYWMVSQWSINYINLQTHLKTKPHLNFLFNTTLIINTYISFVYTYYMFILIMKISSVRSTIATYYILGNIPCWRQYNMRDTNVTLSCEQHEIECAVQTAKISVRPLLIRVTCTTCCCPFVRSTSWIAVFTSSRNQPTSMITLTPPAKYQHYILL